MTRPPLNSEHQYRAQSRIRFRPPLDLNESGGLTGSKESWRKKQSSRHWTDERKLCRAKRRKLSKGLPRGQDCEACWKASEQRPSLPPIFGWLGAKLISGLNKARLKRPRMWPLSYQRLSMGPSRLRCAPLAFERTRRAAAKTALDKSDRAFAVARALRMTPISAARMRASSSVWLSRRSAR